MRIYIVTRAASKGIEQLDIDPERSGTTYVQAISESYRRWIPVTDYSQDVETAKVMALQKIADRRVSLQKTLLRLDKLEYKARNYQPKK